MASNIPIIEDAGSMKNGVWVPDWKAMTSQAKKLGAKTVKTRSGKVIYFDNNYNPTSVDENPQMKAGGKVASSKTVTCSNCGWSWNKSDSSNKDMYVCHQCGRDNSNKSESWLDKYDDGGTMQEYQENYNDYSVSAPEEMQGDGYSNVGRDYSPAWGGQFAMGGSLSGSVGFTYARTAGSAPANGKYTKKTLASAQDGKDVAKNWLKNWYEERKELPQFTEIASKRSNVIDEDIPVVLKPASEMKKMNAIAAYNTKKKYIEATDPSTMADVSTQVDPDLGVSPYVLGHEMVHHLDITVPQVGKNVSKYPISSRDVNFVSPKQSGLSSNDYDWITSDALPNTRTEANAVLYGLREAEGLKGNKPTTPDQLKGIIEKYNNLKGEDINPRTKKGLRNTQIKMLIDSFGGDPEKLSEINNRIVKGFSKDFPTAQNGQEMSYYQHGLDFKTKGMKNGGWLDVPQAQEGNVFAKREQPTPASESTSTIRNIKGEGKSTTATTGQRKEDVKLDTEGMARFKAAETKDKQERIAERKSAIAAKDKGKPFTLPTGESKKYEDMDWREKAYVSGKSLESKGRFNENDEALYDDINPVSWITDIAGGLATAPLEARDYDSNLPYVGAVLNPLIQGALGFDPLGGAMKVPGRVAQSMESGILSNTRKLNPFAENLNDPLKSYRVAGMDAAKDFENTGVLRSVTPPTPEGASLLERAKNRPTSFPSFQKGYADMRYLPEEGGVVFETGLPTYKRGEINPVTGNAIRGRHYAHRAIDPNTGSTLSEIPGENIRMFGDKPHWLKGYQEVPRKEQGGVVKDDMGYWNPDNYGKVVEIDSPYITMEGVDEPLIGISDEGDKKYMLPGKNYKFKGKKVREYPVAKNGLRQEQKGLQNLDQLTNFTNYNKPQPGGWLDKYN